MVRCGGRRALALGLALTAAASASALPACGGKTERVDASSAKPLAIEVTEPSRGRYRYSAPASIPAGLVRITLRNAGREPHKGQLMGVQAGHTIDEALKARAAGGPIPDWLYYAGGVGTTAPGTSASVLQRLNPGSYYVTGSGSERGEVARLRVVGRAGGEGLPGAAGAVSADDYTFKSSGLKAGRHMVEFDNAGFEPHHVVAVPITPGATIADVRKHYSSASTGPPPFDLSKAQETAVLEQGQRQVTELTWGPGTYALLCFVRDRAGGAPHVARGMVEQASVR